MSETSEWNAFNNAVIDEFRANEGNRLFRAQADLMPNFDEYATKTTRVIPVVVIERA